MAALYEIHDIKRAADHGNVLTKRMHVCHGNRGIRQCFRHPKFPVDRVCAWKQCAAWFASQHECSGTRLEFECRIGLTALQFGDFKWPLKAGDMVAQPATESNPVYRRYIHRNTCSRNRFRAGGDIPKTVLA